MRVGVVGFPLSGKSTIFSAITALGRENLRLSDEQLAAVKIPEPRLDWLEKVYEPKKRTEATMEFVDLPGLREGDSEHAGFEKHLPTLRQVDLLLIVLRAFENESVPVHGGSIDPQRDMRLLKDEMLLADLSICSNRIDKLESTMKKPSDKKEEQKRELDLLVQCRAALENEKPLSTVVQPGEQEKMVRSFGFLTQKPFATVFNVSESRIGKEPPFRPEHSYETFALCGSIEADIMQVDAADRAEFMGGYGISALARDRIIRGCFDGLNMINFLTAGPEEVRAWPIPKGFTAVEAAGKIHTDLAKGFIKAETIAFEDLRTAGSMRDAKAANKLRQEPKGYVIQDGDVILFKHSG